MAQTTAPHAGMRNSAFGGLASAAIGFLLLEAGCILLKTRVLAHLLAVAAGATLVLLMLRRFLRYWPPTAESLSRQDQHARHQLRRVLRISAYAIVGAAGYFSARWLSYGFISPLILLAAGLVVAPWTRLSATRAHCLGYGSVGVCGIGTALFVGRSSLDPLSLFIATWFLWMSTLVAWASMILYEKQQRPRGSARPRPEKSHQAHAARTGTVDATQAKP